MVKICKEYNLAIYKKNSRLSYDNYDKLKPKLNTVLLLDDYNYGKDL